MGWRCRVEVSAAAAAAAAARPANPGKKAAISGTTANKVIVFPQEAQMRSVESPEGTLLLEFWKCGKDCKGVRSPWLQPPGVDRCSQTTGFPLWTVGVDHSHRSACEFLLSLTFWGNWLCCRNVCPNRCFPIKAGLATADILPWNIKITAFPRFRFSLCCCFSRFGCLLCCCFTFITSRIIYHLSPNIFSP